MGTVYDALADAQAKIAVPKGRNNDFGGLSLELLNLLVRYEPETGKLFWKERSQDLFRDTNGRSKAHACANWNAQYAGKEAFTARDKDGYKKGSVFNRTFKAHRIAWALSHGEWPLYIDHINGKPDDNRLCNLRNVTRVENQQNLKRSKLNKSGSCGVSWDRHRSKWTARIRVNGKLIALGRFENLDGAISARKAAEKEHGFHEMHGAVK